MKDDLWEYTQFYLSPFYAGYKYPGQGFNFAERADYNDSREKLDELEEQYPGVPDEMLENDVGQSFWEALRNNVGTKFKTDTTSHKILSTYGLNGDAGNYLKILKGLKPFWSQSPFFDGAGYKKLSSAEQSKLPQYLLYLYGNDSNFKRAIDSGNTDLANALLDNSLLNDKDYLKKSLTYGKKDFTNTNAKTTEASDNTGTTSPPTEPTVNSVGQSLLSQTPEEKAQRDEFERQRREEFERSMANAYVDPYANNELRRKNREYMENRGY